MLCSTHKTIVKCAEKAVILMGESFLFACTAPPLGGWVIMTFFVLVSTPTLMEQSQCFHIVKHTVVHSVSLPHGVYYVKMGHVFLTHCGNATVW